MAKRKRKQYSKNQLENRQKISYTTTVLDVVIPVHGEVHFLKESIPSLIASLEGISHRIFIVETGSQKQIEVIEYLNSYPEIKVYPLKEKIGYLGGCNYGAKQGYSPYILITTADVALEKDAIKYLLERIKINDKIGIVSPKLLFPVGSPNGEPGTIQHAGMESNISGDFIHIFLGWNKNHPKVNNPRPCLTCTGACFLTRRAIWNHLDGFDPMFGMGTYEDMDYCLRLQSIGYQVWYEPKAVGTHYVAGSVTVSGNYDYNLSTNRSLFVAKWQGNYPWSEWAVW